MYRIGLPEVSPDRFSLSEALRERTSALHAEAERSGIVSDILRGKADRRGYALLLRNLLPAYAEMEAQLERCASSPALRAFARQELRRADRIVADLVTLSGPRWQHELALLPEAERYAARVAAADGGVRLVAHAYVRYFGDLSGGIVLKRLLMASLGLGPEAMTFYDLPPGADPKALKQQMRDAIDHDVATADGEIVVAEGLSAFEHNIDVSRAVQSFANSPA
jgi:heme oxygenase (biliverdin-producing, ferredoxin)